MDDTQLDHLLHQRAAEPPSADLAERIIHAAVRTPQRRRTDLLQWLNETLGSTLLPRPTYALASMLMIGVMVGWMLPAANASTHDTFFEEDSSL